VTLDVLRLPILGSFLRWRYSRFVLQVPLLVLAVLAIYDGFTGRQLAPTNTATVAVWVHYRGLVALALAVFGNVFCAACPLMLTRGSTKFLKRFLPEFHFPNSLKNKYLVIGATILFLFTYEYFDLWASPWITAWLIIGYFVAALVVDAVFPVGTFCKYVCPLGNFNFALSKVSPTQITAINQSVCSSCEGKYCLNGRLETSSTRAPIQGNRAEHVLLQLEMRVQPQLEPMTAKTIGAFPGCETNLFVPSIQSNEDCTLCLNCLRACPYDNVALLTRSPLRETVLEKPKSDWTWFMVLLTWAGLLNAFAMIPPYFAVATWLSGVLQTRDEAMLLGIIFIVAFGFGLSLTVLAAKASRASLRDWVGALYPLTLAIWGGHYLFHFVTGASTLMPNIISALLRLGVGLEPPALVSSVRLDAIFPFQVVVSYMAFFASLFAIYQKASRLSQSPKDLILRMLPQVLLVLLINTMTILIFSQPMQARGSLLL
jgi:polyferredoxin